MAEYDDDDDYGYDAEHMINNTVSWRTKEKQLR